MATINYTRHYTARVHQSFDGVEVTSDMQADPTYFDQETGDPTPEFDQWVCDNYVTTRDETDPLDDWELETEIDPDPYA